MEIKARAEIVWSYRDESRARAIAQAVEVDNRGIPEKLKKSLNVETRWENGKVITKVKYSGEIESLIVALDDLVFSVKIAEEVT